MQKEEFPTFLNEQPKIIFGRTGRELLIIVLGLAGVYVLWQSISGLRSEAWWGLLCLLVCVLLVIASVIFALVNIANRPLEEWAAAWLLYTFTPKLYLFQQLEEENAVIEQPQKTHDRSAQQAQTLFEQ
jgi:hypothetical protein